MNDQNFLDTTVDEWREAIFNSKNDDPGLTISELSERLHLSRSVIRKKIHSLIKMGKCKEGKARKLDSLGRYQIVPVYDLIGEANE